MGCITAIYRTLPGHDDGDASCGACRTESSGCPTRTPGSVAGFVLVLEHLHIISYFCEWYTTICKMWNWKRSCHRSISIDDHDDSDEDGSWPSQRASHPPARRHPQIIIAPSWISAHSCVWTEVVGRTTPVHHGVDQQHFRQTHSETPSASGSSSHRR